MEENQNYFIKNAMTFGALTGVTLSVLLIISLFLFSNNSAGLLDYIVIIVGITLGIKTLRDKFEGGYISYNRALKTGISISFFTGIIYSLAVLLVYQLKPELLEQIILQAEEMLLKRGMSEDEVEVASSMYDKMLSPITMGIMMAFMFTLLGLLFSLFISIFMKRERNPFDQNNDALDQNSQEG